MTSFLGAASPVAKIRSRLTLRNALAWGLGPRDIALVAGRVVAISSAGQLPHSEIELDLAGRTLLPGLVNAHDHLDFSTFPPLGSPPYTSVYAWAEAVDAGASEPAARAALSVPLPDRLFLGGLRNLLAGVTAVAHHGPFHRSLARDGFPVRVLEKYAFAHSPGLTPKLRSTYRTTDRRIPWMVHAAEGTDERCAGEIDSLVAANVLRQNTIIVHGIALRSEDLPRIAAARACVVWCPESNRHLYGATAPVAALRAAGVRLGLGSDSPVSGVRDALSNLAAGAREAVFGQDDLLSLATRDSAEVARLPVGAFEVGAPADLLVAEPVVDLLAGDRRAIQMLIVAGRPLYGDPGLMEVVAPRSLPLLVDDARKRLDASLVRRAASLAISHSHLESVPWLTNVRFS